MIKTDLDKEAADLWVLDVATGRGIQLASSQSRERAGVADVVSGRESDRFRGTPKRPLQSLSESCDRGRG